MFKISGTSFRDVKFINCKLLGVHFEDSNILTMSVSFRDCIINLASFFKIKLKNTMFASSKITEADFTEADLTGSVFENCDLSRTIFNRSVLEKVDFRTSFNYSIDPEENRIRKAKFSLNGISGLLEKYDIFIENQNP